ncbi:MAG: hypothetical protein RR101_10305 [Burkholderiaceae bacterium]
MKPFIPLWFAFWPVWAAGLLLAGCAAPSMEAQWRNPAFKAGSLQGRSVWIDCSARDETTALVCEDQLASQLAAGGVRVVRGAATQGNASGDALAGARAAGAASVLVIQLESRWRPASSPGASIGIGLGGGSWGGGGSVSGGLAMPIGGGGGGESLAAQATLTGVAEAQTLWSGTLRASGNGTAAEQIGGMVRITLEALKQAGAL